MAHLRGPYKVDDNGAWFGAEERYPRFAECAAWVPAGVVADGTPLNPDWGFAMPDLEEWSGWTFHRFAPLDGKAGAFDIIEACWPQPWFAGGALHIQYHEVCLFIAHDSIVDRHSYTDAFVRGEDMLRDAINAAGFPVARHEAIPQAPSTTYRLHLPDAESLILKADPRPVIDNSHVRQALAKAKGRL